MALIPLLISSIPDTASDRRSAWNWGRTRMRTLPLADGSIDLGDRQHLLGLYSGIGAPEPPPPEDTFGKGIGSFTIGGRARAKLLSGSNLKGIGGRGGRGGVGGSR